MTDRELLELAAKAAGLEPQYDTFENAYYLSQRKVGKEVWTSTASWNPLTDDGDALRLAVKSELDILLSPDQVEVLANTGQVPELFAIEPFACDKHAATRRAITRAAAEIGRTL